MARQHRQAAVATMTSLFLLLLVLVLVLATTANAASSSSSSSSSSTTPAHSSKSKGNKKSPYATTAYVDAQFTTLFKFLQPIYGHAVTTLSEDGRSCTTFVETPDAPHGSPDITADRDVRADAAIPSLIAKVRCPFPYILASEATCEGSLYDRATGDWQTLLYLQGSGTTAWVEGAFATGFCVVATESAGAPVPAESVVRIHQFITCTYDSSVYDAQAARQGGDPAQQAIGALLEAAKARGQSRPSGGGGPAMVGSP